MKYIYKDIIKYMKYIIIFILVILIFLIIYNRKYLEHFSEINFILDSSGKLEINDQCEFDGIGFNTSHEVGECSVAMQIIPLCKNVIEIGGGAGKVSHMINKVLSKKNLETQHIVVEPGITGLGNHGDTNIYENKQKFNDKYTIVKKLCDDLTMDDLSILNEKPDCLYVDCEGCLLNFQNTDIGHYILNNVRFIVNEMDGDIIIGKGTDDKIRKQWIKFGFKNIGIGYGCGKDCTTEIWSK